MRNGLTVSRFNAAAATVGCMTMLLAATLVLTAPAPAGALNPPSVNLVENALVRGSSEQGVEGNPAGAVADGYDKTNWTTSADDRDRQLTIRLPGAPTETAREVVRSYWVRSATQAPDRIPSSWILEATDDGRTWTELDRRSGAVTKNGQTAEFEIADPRPFHTYRLSFGASSAGPIEVADIALCEQRCSTSIQDLSENMNWPITTHGEFVTINEDGVSTALADGLAGTAWTARPGSTLFATATITAPSGQPLPMSNYLIVAGDNPQLFPRSWKIEGSNDGNTWGLVDEQSDVQFSSPHQAIEFDTDFGNRNYRFYRLNTAKTGQFGEIVFCPRACGALTSSAATDLINPVRSDFEPRIGNEPTTIPALTSETDGATWALDPNATTTVEFIALNQQAQPVGSYSVQADTAEPLSWTVWGKRSTSDSWTQLDSRTGFVGDGSLANFGLAPRFPVAAVKVEFATGAGTTNLDRFSLCGGPDCQTELTGAPSNPTTTVWQAQSSNSLGGATLVGNGPLGAMVYGGVAQERLGLNEHQIWQGSPLARGRTVTAEIRDRFVDAVYANDTALVDQIVRDHLLDPVAPASYQTAGDLLIDTHSGSRGYQYRRSLDAATGVATVSYIGQDGATFTRRTAASFADPVIISNLSVAGGSQDLTLRYDSPMPNVAVSAQKRTAVSAQLIVDGTSDGFSRTDPALRYRAQIIVRANNGAIDVVDNTIEITDTSSVDLMIAIDTNLTDYQHLTADPAQLTAQNLGGNYVNRRSFDNLLQRHLDAYTPLFNRVSFEFPATAADRLPTDRRARARPDDPAYYALEAQYARYLLMASSRNGEPATLQGRWNNRRWPSWWSDYHLDINLQMNYSIAENLNVPETTDALFDFIDDLAVEGRRIAAEQYGVTNGGWVAHVTADLWRQSPVVRGTHTQWVQGGNWIAQTLWNHYRYSGDNEFLAERAYPILRGSALFFDSILVTSPDPGDDHLVHFWSTSPENHPERADRAKLPQVQMMPTMDAQLIRETYEHVIEASTTLGVDADLRAQWTENLARLPAPDPIGGWGQIQEYYRDIDREGDQHRHASHLYGAAEGYTLDLENPTVANAVRTTLRRRGGGTAWASAWTAMIAARLGDPTMTLERLQSIAGSAFPNLLSNASNVPQIDATFGSADAFVEMLVQSHRGSVDLLPALPANWATGRVGGVRAQGGFTITDLAWDQGRLSEVSIRSEVGGLLVVRYGGQRVELTTTPGQVIRLDGSLAQIG